MNRTAALITAAAFAWLAMPCRGQDQPSEFWVSFISKNSLSVVADQLRQDVTHWPSITSVVRAANLPKKEREEMLRRIEMASQLLKKTQTQFRAKVPASRDELRKEVDTLSTLSDKMSEAEGYVNLLLADSFNRLIIYRMSGWLIANPSDTEFCKELIAAAPEMSPNYLEVLRKTAADDSALTEKEASIEKIKSQESIFHALDVIGMTQNDVFALTQPESSKTSKLFENPSAVALAARTVQTAAIKDVHLAGLISFFEKGGDISELNPSDVTAFEKRLGGELRDYKCPQLGIRRLSADHLLALIDLQRDQAAGNVFLDAALE
jgi:hypothetical protein